MLFLPCHTTDENGTLRLLDVNRKMGWVDIMERLATEPPTKKEAEQVFEYGSRKAKPRFYADENFPAKAVQVLRGMGARVLTAKDADLVGHSDEDHASYALKYGYVLLTCDRDYLDDRRFPLIQCPVIAVFDFGSGSQAEIRQSFRCLKTIFGFPQIFDKWVKIDAKRDSWTEHTKFLNGSTSRTRYRLYRGRLEEWVEDQS